MADKKKSEVEDDGLTLEEFASTLSKMWGVTLTPMRHAKQWHLYEGVPPGPMTPVAPPMTRVELWAWMSGSYETAKRIYADRGTATKADK